MAPSEVSHGTMGPVEWLRYNDNPRVMNTDTRKTRGFIENFQQYFKKFIKGSLLPLVPKTLSFSGNQHSPGPKFTLNTM